MRVLKPSHGIPALRCDAWCDACNAQPGGPCCNKEECSGCTDGCARPPPPPASPPPWPRHWKSPPSPPPPPPNTAEYWTSGASIWTNAFELSDTHGLLIKGVSWFGLESGSCYIGGGPGGPLRSYAQFLQVHGFNAVRVPLAADAIAASLRGRDAACLNHGIYINFTPELEGKGCDVQEARAP